MIVYDLKSELVRQGDSIPEHLFHALKKRNLRLRTNDVVAISSKIIGMSEGRIRELTKVRPSPQAAKLSHDYSLSPQFAQIVLDEADAVLGGVKGALLTIINGDATANAGVDRKNSPDGSVVLWPHDPDSSARRIRDSIRRRFRKKVGVVIVDSRVTPLRLGTIGFAIGSAGFETVEDIRKTADLFGRPVEITLRAIADGLAATAHLVMGEAREQKPFVLIRGAPVRFGTSSNTRDTKLAQNRCLYMSQMTRKVN